MVQRILRFPSVVESTGRSRPSIYRDIRAGLFTKPIKLGARASGWPESEPKALQEARIAGKTDTEIRALVRELEAQRTAGAVQ